MLGTTIADVREMTEGEMDDEGWEGMAGAVIVLSDGTRLFASRDSEGNGPGVIFGKNKDGTSFRLGN